MKTIKYYSDTFYDNLEERLLEYKITKNQVGYQLEINGFIRRLFLTKYSEVIDYYDLCPMEMEQRYAECWDHEISTWWVYAPNERYKYPPKSDCIHGMSINTVDDFKRLERFLSELHHNGIIADEFWYVD